MNTLRKIPSAAATYQTCKHRYMFSDCTRIIQKSGPKGPKYFNYLIIEGKPRPSIMSPNKRESAQAKLTLTSSKDPT